ncbi:MAG: leucyl/phenylalanyl-tRNA--protein transferase [Salibacteraceae bacterium]
MPIYQLNEAMAFPRPELADDDGLLAVGGDMSVERVMLAYEHGIFPWYHEEQPILWWSPPRRMMLYPGKLKVSKSLRRSIKNKGFELRIDFAFYEVIMNCAQVKRKDQEDTWINQDTIAVFQKLHNLGFAHSFEIWKANELVGGLYGLSLGKAFFGESMFSKETDASKAAFYYLHAFIVQQNFHFVDCQLHNDHLASLGAYEVPREQYLSELKSALAYPDIIGKWNQYL